MQELHKLGKPLIVVYINGRPIAEPWIVEHADAILEAWYPGQEGGHAIADILFGEVNPSGRLTISVPKHVGQLPVYYYKRRTRGKRYLETDFHAEYPFGYGLSFTEFGYSNLKVEPPVISADEEALVSVDVTNRGDRAGSEVVQLYISDLVSSITRPEKQLKGFRKISLQPGDTQTVMFRVGREEPGICISGSDADRRAGRIRGDGRPSLRRVSERAAPGQRGGLSHEANRAVHRMAGQAAVG